jgi:hypothetical protein
MAMEMVFEKTRRLYVYSFLILSLFVPLIYAAEIYVYPQSQENSSNSEIRTMGATVMYPNIQAAIDDAVDGDVIYLARGRYKGDGNRDLDFKGKAITLSGLRPEDSNYVAATIIDCNGTAAEPHRGFYFHSGEDNNSVVCGLTITKSYNSKDGSAIYCYQSSPYLHHCNIVANNGLTGSVVYISGSSILADCTVADNNNIGYAVYVYGYSSTKRAKIINCTVRNNTSSSYSCSGIYGSDYLEIINCRVEKNSGSGIYTRGSRSVKISGCLVRSNGNVNNYPSASGIASASLVENSTIIDNIGTGVSSCAEIRNCFIGYNSTYGVSNCQRIINSKIIGNGGVGISYPSTISNCIVAKNKKQGVYYPSGKITNCTVIDNNSAGIQLSSSTVKITNCIVRDNYLEQIKNVTTSTTIAYTNSYKSDTTYGYPRYIPYTGTGNINEEPMFISEKDYHLAAGSPCIDTGTNDANFVTEANDIDGSERIIDGDSNGTAIADMGAYEYNTNEPVIAVWADRLVCFTNAGNEVRGKIYIKNAGAGTLNYEILSDENWLTIDNPSGASGGEVAEVNVVIDANGLELGDYHCRIKVYSGEAVNSGTEYLLNVHIGTLWTVPVDVNTIQDAINAASNYDYIRVMDGNYTGTGNRDINFNGKNLVLYSDSGNPANCIINCEGFYGIKLISHEAEAVVDGFLITRAIEAVTCDACSSPVITNCIFSNSSYGIYARRYCSLEISRCKFLNISSYGLYCYGYTFNKISVNNCGFYGQGRGNGVNVVYGDKIIVEDCNFLNISSTIYCAKIKEVFIKDCLVQGCVGGISLSEICKFDISNSILRKNKWSGRTSGIILLANTNGAVYNCKIIDNKTNNSIPCISMGSFNPGNNNVLVENCLLAANDIGCIVASTPQNNITFENCTFTDNRRYMLQSYTNNKVSFKNCILWDANIVNPSQTIKPTPNISYSDVRGGYAGVGNINVPPRFVREGYWDANGTSTTTNDDFWVQGDYHLMSEGWRWDADANEWVYDELTSRCIDAGSPGWPLGSEATTLDIDPENSWGENLRIDMGYYGGTDEASMPPYDWALLSDLDNSGWVNNLDLAYLESFYGQVGKKIDGDLNRDGVVDLSDVALLTEDWLKHTDWAPRK